jgi:hypothetical protein
VPEVSSRADLPTQRTWPVVAASLEMGLKAL